MPQIKKLDNGKVLELLRVSERPTDQVIANQLGVSREAIRLKRHQFIQQGLINDKPAKKGVLSTKQPTAVPQLNLEQIIEVVLVAFERAKEYPKVAAELEQYKRGYSNLKEAIAGANKVEQRRKEQEQRFKLARQQGELKVEIPSTANDERRTIDVM
jgi:hypothetical protein